MGCAPSRDSPEPKSVHTTDITAVGYTERNMTRKERSNRLAQQPATHSETPDELSDDRPLPQLDSKGRLMPEEVAKRTFNSKSVKTLHLGTEEFPIEVKVGLTWLHQGGLRSRHGKSVSHPVLKYCLFVSPLLIHNNAVRLLDATRILSR